ncbi:MAG: substrate-binding domain-containing protein [Lachnospiraceae bacterium]|nr:substrate-binding domain-containing protein [Lachnospiraceae bacterium]
MGLQDKKHKKSQNDVSHDQLQEFIDLTKTSVITLSESIDNVTLGMDSTIKDNSHISGVVNDVSRSTGEQLRLVQNTSVKIEQLHSSVNTITESIDNMQELAIGSNEAVNNGRMNLDTYKTHINEVTASMQETANFIGILRENIAEIAETIKLIVRISDQLNMLSLNSSIEAARAGEAGRGFSVVAQQITVLSNDTKTRIGNINDILKKIMESSENVEDSINKSISDLENSNAIFDETLNSFGNITEKNKAVINKIDDVEKDIENISHVAKTTSDLSQQLSDSAQSINDMTEQVTEIIETEQDSFNNINSTVNDLKFMLGRLEGLVNKYNKDIRPVSKTPSETIKIGVVMPFGHEFWMQVREGVLYAKKELSKKNCIVDFMPIEDITLQKYMDAVNKCIDEKYAGIAMVGYYEELAALVDKAASKGIPCITFNSEFETPSKRLTFVGQNAYDSGVISADTIAKKIGEKGNILVVTSDKNITNHEIRRSGFNETISKYKDINLVGLIECHDSNDEAYKKVKDYLAKNRDLDGIYITAGGQMGTVNALADYNLTGKVKVVLYDFMQEILEAISKGSVTAAIGQDPFRQGHDPIIYLFNNAMNGELPPEKNMWTRIDVVDKSNVGNYLT